MKVFILEDDSNRVDLFLEWLKGHSITLVASCEDADAFDPPYDVIFLDHDLGGRQLEAHEDCGLTFLKLVATRINPEAVVVVHSYNAEGARNMLNVLADLKHPKRVYQPFGPSLKQIIDVVERRLCQK